MRLKLKSKRVKMRIETNKMEFIWKLKMRRKKMKRLRLFSKKELKIFLLKVEGKINRMILKKGSRKWTSKDY